MKIWRLLYLAVAVGGSMLYLQGCAFTAGAATGVAGDEVLHHKGYELGSPIHKEDDDDDR